MSPTVYKTKPYDEFGIILIGASSQEELAASLLEGYQCCSFAGNMVALTFNTIDDPFTVLWNISMLPSPQGNWSGAAIWGSQPSIDPIRSQAFIGTGNVYTLPEEYALCQNQTTSLAVVAKDPCLPPNVLQDSIVALDIMTGLINWADQLTPLDAFNTACDPTAPASSKHNCPFTPGPDADFGMAPTFIPGGSGTPYGRDTVVIGQKNGNLYAVSAQAGRLFWSITTSPDGSAGGLVWGVAVDETQVYFTALNFNQVPFLLQPSGQNIINSAFGAASLKDGSLIWEVQSLPEASLAEVPPTVVNDIVLVGTTGANISDAYTGNGGVLKILDKHTGKLIKSVALNANFHGGIAVQGQYIMFGTGYQEFVNGTGSFYVLRA
jgi:outer membrane protein assembly factor BamB